MDKNLLKINENELNAVSGGYTDERYCKVSLVF